MGIECSKCGSEEYVKNGNVRGKQRYICKLCGYNFVEIDERIKHDNRTKNLVIRMYLNNCGIRRISEILEVPVSTVLSWIKRAGEIVDKMVNERQETIDKIEVLEMDELWTFVKKNRNGIEKQGKRMENIPEYGLLWIGTDLKLLHLR